MPIQTRIEMLATGIRSQIGIKVLGPDLGEMRPKIMTVSTTILGLLPVMWSVGSGSQAMKRIAAPMVGGMVSSTLLTLIIIPAIYSLWRGREAQAEEQPATTGGKKKRGTWLRWFGALALCVTLVGGWFLWKGGRFGEAKLTEPILSEQVGDYRFEIFGRKPQVSTGNNPVRIQVKDPATGQLVDVGSQARRGVSTTSS